MKYDGLEASYWNAQIERIERLRAKIAARAVSSPGRIFPADQDLVIGTGRRIPATILFTDISGFSARASTTAEEQEMLLRVLNLYFTEMIRVVEDYGGTVEKNTGDGLMAYFEELPGEGVNSTQRAVACALTMNAANDIIIAQVLRASNVNPIQHRMSIEHGLITVARIGAAQRFNANVAIGNAANFASKMLANLQAGQIGLGSNAWSRLPEMWRTNWTERSPISTGWTQGLLDIPYPLFLYTGRWTRLI